MAATDGLPEGSDRREIYEIYRSWFAGGCRGFQPDHGLCIFLQRGMKAWLESDISGTGPINREFHAISREGVSDNELVVLLASIIGG